jgi:hypothetical protein
VEGDKCKRRKDVQKGGKFDQSTLHECMKTSQRNSLLVQLIYANDKSIKYKI